MSNDDHDRDDPEEPDDHSPDDTVSGEADDGRPPADDATGGDDGGDRHDDDGSDDSWVSDSVDEGGEPTAPDSGPSSGPAGEADDASDHDAHSAATATNGSGEKGPGEKFCTECGAVINEKAEICPECGVRQPGMSSGGDDERIIAAVLAIVLGGLGAHKFYMGKVGQGIVYLCFSWTLIPAIIGLVEGIIYLTKSDEEFHEQYMAD